MAKGNANSLGMTFISVPGTRVEFCQHETRECDMAVYNAVPNPGTRAATHVSWHEARAFCDWLTDREHQRGVLPANQRYRLPTDHEWSCAAGIGAREDSMASPESKRQRFASEYPWGMTWPPPSRAGNYFGHETTGIVRDATPIDHFDDGMRGPCEVMRFKPNALGLHDLGGNVWEWCEDEFRPGTGWRVLRGAAWNCARPEALLSSHRTFDPPEYRSDTVGFRLVRARE